LASKFQQTTNKTLQKIVLKEIEIGIDKIQSNFKMFIQVFLQYFFMGPHWAHTTEISVMLKVRPAPDLDPELYNGFNI